MNAFLTGVLAGYGIAIPVGAIAILILETGLRDGFKNGFWAGAGAASADLLYAAIASVLGSVAISILGPFSVPLRAVSGLVLLTLGSLGLWKLHVQQSGSSDSPIVRKGVTVYLQFLSLTLLNPMTIVYFAALILGGASGADRGVTSRILFIVGAGIASLSWQILLAASASLLRTQFSDRGRRILSLTGNLIICAFGIAIVEQVIGGN